LYGAFETSEKEKKEKKKEGEMNLKEVLFL